MSKKTLSLGALSANYASTDAEYSRRLSSKISDPEDEDEEDSYDPDEDEDDDIDFSEEEDDVEDEDQ